MTMKKSILFTCIFTLLLMGLWSPLLAQHIKQNPAKISEQGKFDVVYQRCEWTIDTANNPPAAILGAVTFYFKAIENDLQNLIFDLRDNMIVDSIMYHGVSIGFEHYDDYIHIPFSETFPLNEMDSISIIYNGNPISSGLGSFRRSTHGTGVNRHPIIWTLSAPYGAADWFPCKNDVTDKIDSIDILIKVPKGNLAASNGRLVSIKSVDDEWDIHHWHHGYPIATYLVCLAVTNYVAYSDWYKRSETDSLEILNYVYPESLNSAKEKTPKTIESMGFFEELFGVYPYPDEKYGHAQFGWGGGMEHQTMSFMVNFDYDLIAHELSHQWFGNMITCGTWHDIWLNEGFGTYATALYQERYYPSAWKSWKSSTIANVVSSDKGSVYCLDTANLNHLYSGRLVYNKGALVLHTLRWVIGDDDFFKAMWNYAHDENLRYGSAVTSDFIKHAEEASGRDLTDFFATWIYGEEYPRYEFNIEQTDPQHAILMLTQTPSDQSVKCFNMPVPILFSGAERDTLIVFHNNALEQNFPFSPGFIIKSVTFDPDRWLICRQKSLFVGIDEVENGYFLDAFPNPFNGFVSVKYRLPEKATWTLSDMSGKVVKTGNLSTSEGDANIALPDLEQGMYIIRFHSGQNVITRKLMCK